MIDLDFKQRSDREQGGVNVIDFNKNPELDRLRREMCEQNFAKLQKSLKRQKQCDTMAWDTLKHKVVAAQNNNQYQVQRFIPVGKTTQGLIDIAKAGSFLEKLQAEIDLETPQIQKKKF